MSVGSFNGVPIGNIAEINGVPIANIAKINGVDVTPALQPPLAPINLNLEALTGAATLFEDTFTGPDQQLSFHVPDPGPGGAGTWQDPGDLNFSIRSNAVQRVFGSSNVSAVVETGQSDVVISADITHVVNSVSVGLSPRSVAGSGPVWRCDLDAGVFRIRENSSVVRASAGGSASSGTMTVTCTGATISVNYDGEDISYDLATQNQTVTTHGIYLSNPNFGEIIDNFKVTELP